jgi:hypothetical protein
MSLTAETAARLARMCTDLAEVGDPITTEASAVLARLRDGEVTEESGRAALAELEEVLRRHGLVGADAVIRGPSPPGGFQPLPGLGSGRPLEEVYICPGDLCDRVELPRAGVPDRPGCAVWGCPMPLFRMDR